MQRVGSRLDGINLSGRNLNLDSIGNIKLLYDFTMSVLLHLIQISLSNLSHVAKHLIFFLKFIAIPHFKKSICLKSRAPTQQFPKIYLLVFSKFMTFTSVSIVIDCAAILKHYTG